MYYHALFAMSTGYHYWINYAYEDMIRQLIIPYINKQVVPVNYHGGKGICNLGTVSYIQIFKTKESLEEPASKNLADKFQSGEFKNKECTQEIIDLALFEKSAIDSKSLLQNIFTPTARQVFVIMKFDDKILDSAYEGVIKPTINKFRYRPLRIDEIQDSGRITDQILEEIAKSEVVFADLTGERPNCYYEAGFAHAIGKEMVFSVRKGTPVHFDLSLYRFIDWETEDELRQKLQSRFKAIKQRQTLT